MKIYLALEGQTQGPFDWNEIDTGSRAPQSQEATQYLHWKVRTLDFSERNQATPKKKPTRTP